jgi:hypothetical protein
MAVKLDDLDQLLGYDPTTHSVAGLPSIAKPSALQPSAKELGSHPTTMPSMGSAPTSAPPGAMPDVMPTSGTASPSAGIPSIGAGAAPSLAKPKESVWQKLGHGLEKGAEVAGDVLAPGVTAMIPGTKLNKEAEAGREAKISGEQAESNLKGAQAEAAKQGGEMVPFTDSSGQTTQVPLSKWEPLEVARERADALQKSTETKGQTAKDVAATNVAGRADVAAGQNTSRETVAGEANTSREGIARENNMTRVQVAQQADSTRRLIAQEHEAGANSRAALTNSPDKLTNTMKTMKQQAQATLPEIDNAIKETNEVADLLGPEKGRWNNFIQGTIGSPDPRYAHYVDEIHMVSTAVTLAHARGRMSNELFESFQRMFDAGKQSPENMIQALQVSKEWLTGYANMGESATPNSGNTPPAGGGGGTPTFDEWKKKQGK